MRRTTVSCVYQRHSQTAVQARWCCMMVQFTCRKCGHVKDVWSSGSRKLTQCKVDNVVPSKKGKRTRQANHDIHIAVTDTVIGRSDRLRCETALGILIVLYTNLQHAAPMKIRSEYFTNRTEVFTVRTAKYVIGAKGGVGKLIS